MGNNLGSHEINYMPYRRALRLFNNKASDCIFVATDKKSDYPEAAIENGTLLFSRAINEIQLRAYTLADQPIISAFGDFEGKAVAGANSHIRELRARLPEISQVSFVNTETHVKAFELMNRGRVNVVLAYEQDEVQLIEQTLQGPYSYARSFVVESRNEIVSCWKNAVTEKFIALVNETVDELENTDQLKTILEHRRR